MAGLAKNYNLVVSRQEQRKVKYVEMGKGSILTCYCRYQDVNLTLEILHGLWYVE